jgi:predicted  nucleic acid-binding Zn-ribbon protein
LDAAGGRGGFACPGTIPGLDKAGGDGKVGVSTRRKEYSMAGTTAIRKKIGKIEGQLKKRVRSLEKDLASLGKKLEKKESEVKKLKEKMTASFVKDVRKKVKNARKTVSKRLSKIL